MRRKEKHQHVWFYPHAQIEGRTKNETVVVRYCQCGVRQMASATQWKKATGDYALNEHYR
jgi:hypothetical protein